MCEPYCNSFPDLRVLHCANICCVHSSSVLSFCCLMCSDYNDFFNKYFILMNDVTWGRVSLTVFCSLNVNLVWPAWKRFVCHHWVWFVAESEHSVCGYILYEMSTVHDDFVCAGLWFGTLRLAAIRFQVSSTCLFWGLNNAVRNVGTFYTADKVGVFFHGD